jgi:predicted Zn-dependent protease
LRAADLLDQTAKPGAAREISAEIAGMSELAKTREDSDERRLARRILRALLAESNESAAYIYMPQKDYKSAAANFELASLVRPENPYIEINLSRALVLDGRKKEALEALNRAVEKGFKDCNALARDEAFAPLQNNKDFQKLKAAISCIN